MKLLLNTHSGNEYGDGCEYAALNLTPLLATTILARMETFADAERRDKSLVAMDYYDGSPDFLDSLPERLQDTLGSGEDFEEVEYSDEEMEPCVARTECARMVVYRQEVYWTAYPKHCDWQVETRPIPVDVVRRAAEEVVNAD